MIGLSVLAAAVAIQPSFLWIEGESASQTTGADIKPSGYRPGALSGDQWMTFSTEEPSQPEVLLKYSLPPRSQPGSYRFWARVGFEWVRAEMAFRIDGGPWQSLSSKEATTNLVELATWAELAWQKGPEVSLPASAQSLEVRFSRPQGTNRFLFGLDCMALVPAGQTWAPDNRLKPGESYNAPIDSEARQTRYSLPEVQGAARTEAPLNGLWQVARWDDPDMNKGAYEPAQALPPEDQLHWRGINAPSDAWSERLDLTFAHRLVYRTQVDVPASHKGRSFRLDFGGHAWITSVFVNGKLAGSDTATIVPFGFDITPHVKPGEINQIDVVIKGSYYAVDPGAGDLNRTRNQPRVEEFLKYLKWIDCTWPTGKGGGDSIRLGLARPATLSSAGSSYTSDVFVRTSVKSMELTADLEFVNTSANPAGLSVRAEAVNQATGQVEKRFSDQPLQILPNGKSSVRLQQAWPEAKLWWPSESPDDKPVCYLLRVSLLRDGQAIDVSETLFGFRELEVKGRMIEINGVPLPIHALNSIGYGGAHVTPELFEQFHSLNDRGVRMEGGMHVRDYDMYGIPGRLSMAWEGMFGQVAMNNPRMWENWKRHTAQMVKAYRNSPSVFHWVVGNEVHMITGRLFFGGDIGRHEKLLNEVFDVARKLDPTRTVSEDGAGDLGGLSETNNQHYYLNEYKTPRQFYAYPVGPPSTAREGQDFQTLYRWSGANPLIGGEEFYFPGMGNFAWFGGPRVYRGVNERALAGGKYARILLEGARWQNVYQTHPCTPPVPLSHQALARQAVYIREHNSAFAAGSTVTRTIKFFNDSRFPDTLSLNWRVDEGGKTLIKGAASAELAPGGSEEKVLTIKVPSLKAPRTGALLKLEVKSRRRGKAVFVDQRPFDILAPLPPAPLTAGTLAVWDPEGKVAAWLKARGQAFASIADLTAIPASAQAVLVGPNALTEANRAASAQALKTFVGRGRLALVLDQSSPLREADLPIPGILIADQEKGKAARPEWEKVGGHTGAIAHPMALAHPVLKTLTADDFFTWGGKDELNYRLSYATPLTGTVNLVQAGEDLSLAPLIEVLSGNGSLLLSQLMIGDKLGIEPTADRLLENMLAWAAARGLAKPKTTAVWTGGDQVFAASIEKLGISRVVVGDLPLALGAGVDVAVIRATPAGLKELASLSGQVKAFTDRGGWIMLAGLDEGGLASFNQVVGHTHRLRPFRHESVLLEAMEDALAMGISDRDLLQYDPEVIAPWMGLQRVSTKVFSTVVDAGDEVASFAGLGAFREGANRPLTDGLLGDTFWQYTQYISSGGGEPITLTLDRPEPLTSVEIALSDAYFWAKDIEVLVDGKAAAQVTLKKEPGYQIIPLSGAPAKEVVIRLKSTYPAQRANMPSLATIDEVRLRRKWSAPMVSLTRPGGIVKYPRGKGGILLNQVRFDGDDLPENLSKKKQIFASLLRNLGSSFTGGP